MEDKDIRWIQRFQNFDRAFILLSQTFLDRDLEQFSMLEKEGIIQRFEYTYELAWKTLKDYLIENGNVLQEVTPRNVFKEAFIAKIIDDGQVYIDMMLSRNLLLHCYDFEKYNNILEDLKSKYLSALQKLHSYFLERAKGK